MNVLEASSAVLKNSTRVAWWGLAIGIFVGLHIAGALAKPFAGEVNKGLTAVNKGLTALRSKLKKEGGDEERGDLAAEEPTEKKQAAAAKKSFKIPVEDIAPADAAAAAGADEVVQPDFHEVAQPVSQEEPETSPDEKGARASKPESPGGELPSLKWLKADLLEEAGRLGVSVRETMTKRELLDAIKSKTEI